MWIIYQSAPKWTTRKNYFINLMPIADFSAMLVHTVELNLVGRSLLCAATVHRPLTIEASCPFGKRAQACSGRDRAGFITLTISAVESLSSLAVAEIALRIEAPKNMIGDPIEWVQPLRCADSPAARVPTTSGVTPHETVNAFVLSDFFSIAEKSFLFHFLIHDAI